MLLVLVTGLPATGKSTMATVAAKELGSALLGHDWAMSGLRPYRELQESLDGMLPSGHRVVGWSIMWALARAQLRIGSSVVLDGVARAPEVAGSRQVAADEGARCLVVMTRCADADVHRARVDGRQRQIPNWYELDWEHVARSRASWVAPEDVDIVLEATDSVDANADALRAAIGSLS
ncbi:MAG TPA: AAA family ATPase [Acidimicrobiales bacterium]|nr:AAA family ATPase [Acidimicrobiales bacterium]